MNELKSILKINQLVQIEIVKETNEPIRYPSRLENFDENNLVFVSPIKARVLIMLEQGAALNVWFWNSAAIYVFRTYVQKNVLNSVHQIYVSIPEIIERVQNREYVRVKMFLEVLLSYFNADGVEEVIRCTSRDISGGGMMLVINTYVPLPKNTKVRVQFDLEQDVGQHAIKAEGQIIWNEWELDKHGMERNCLGVKFIQIPTVYREMIIKSVYARQIELKKKGLLS